MHDPSLRGVLRQAQNRLQRAVIISRGMKAKVKYHRHAAKVARDDVIGRLYDFLCVLCVFAVNKGLNILYPENYFLNSSNSY
ncbi:hypothetical protein MNBD_NITROSPINAE05-802 [hydrothermal vent metagenome]|uniref:Uncharacterized protein n=1 Tax=hydrothermal vent metagenome TaxID=652676 RepID=A0A3B1CNX9_9ZZZZ